MASDQLNHVFLAATMQAIDACTTLKELYVLANHMKNDQAISSVDKDAIRAYWIARKAVIDRGGAKSALPEDKLRAIMDALLKLLVQLLRPHDVMLVLHPDGWMEACSRNIIRTHFYELPPFNYTAEERIAAEEAFDKALPVKLKGMYYPHAFEDLPGVTDARQVRIEHVDGRPMYRWVSGDNSWDEYTFPAEQTLPPPAKTYEPDGLKRLNNAGWQ